MHQAQHSIPWQAQYPDAQHTTSTTSTVLRHIGEAGIGTTSIKAPPNQILRVQNVRRKAFSENAPAQQPWSPEPSPAPREPGCVSTHTEGAGAQLWEQLLHDWVHPPFLLPQLIRKHHLTPHTNKYLPYNLKLVFSTGQQRSLCLVTLFSTQQDNPLLALSNHHTKKKHYLFHFRNAFDLSLVHYVKMKSFTLCLICQYPTGFGTEIPPGSFGCWSPFQLIWRYQLQLKNTIFSFRSGQEGFHTQIIFAAGTLTFFIDDITDFPFVL